MAYKVFTNGSVLQASEINDNLMRQSVMVFGNAAARTAAITSPVEGMVTYLESTDRIEWWSGSAWRSPYGLTQLVNTNFSAAGAVFVDNVFTTEFDNYKVMIKVDAHSVGGTIAVSWQFRKAGSTITAANYRQGGFFSSPDGPSTGQYMQTSGASSVGCMVMGAGGPTSSYSNIELFTPAVSGAQTGWTNSGFHLYGGATPTLATKIGYFANGAYTVNDNFDGFVLGLPSGTMNGNVKVYGYRN